MGSSVYVADEINTCHLNDAGLVCFRCKLSSSDTSKAIWIKFIRYVYMINTWVALNCLIKKIQAL